jgi:hypothetical protein
MPLALSLSLLDGGGVTAPPRNFQANQTATHLCEREKKRRV